ncbi:uncharacterized protein LOC122533826 [Frieseomelitta varia]|uniref:uncharacterized protein LOC122533826 n=1 Tax=Frieseomelitta varia TaxID=561572 RepID=UPI001CB6A8F5|nr:uncharacterized protein LOC122533826 [Frieseomelitta varia]
MLQIIIMQSPIAKLLLVVLLCIVSLSHVKASNKVTVQDMEVDIPSNNIVQSWEPQVANNLINSKINIKHNCPGEVEADIKVYQGDDVVSQTTKKFDKPIKDFESMNICTLVQGSDFEEDSCSIGMGEQLAEECDVSEWFSEMKPGDYKAKCDFKQGDEVITTVTLSVKVESDV